VAAPEGWQDGGVSEQTHRERISVDHPATERVNQPGREEGVVRAGAAPVEHERPEDWGWHGETGRWGRIGGVIATLFMLAYLFGNHEGRIEDLWVVAIAGLMILVLLLDWRRRRNAWRAK
jgi:hypothetical protein